MGDEDLLHPPFVGRLHQQLDLPQGEVGRPQDGVVLGDELQHHQGLVHHLAVLDRGDGLAPDEVRPAALGVVAAPGPVDLHVVGRVDGRHPDLLGAQPEAHLGRGRVDAAHELVHHHAAEHLDVGEVLLDEVGPAHRAFVVALQHDGGHARVRRGLHRLAVVHPPLEYAGIRMHVQVHRAVEFHEFHNVPSRRPPGARLRSSISSIPGDSDPAPLSGRQGPEKRRAIAAWNITPCGQDRKAARPAPGGSILPVAHRQGGMGYADFFHQGRKWPRLFLTKFKNSRDCF